jgi:saccharopine dehydrogenase (NAD+, L-lysine-forming)
MATGRFLLYGANGYTGVLIAEEARRRGLAPVLAGRREEAVRPLAERLGLEHRAFALDDARALDAALAETGTILLAAGPFSATSRGVVDACLRARAHYLDITGEIAVFEACFARDAEARDRGVTVLPGVGFDVVPSDCLAASLKAALPGATHLELAFASQGSPSKGTSITMVEGLPHGGAVRVDGRIRPDPAASRVREVRFRDRPRLAVAIPWGDVSTAFRSTAIPNIVLYMAAPRGLVRLLRLTRPLLPLAGTRLAQRVLKHFAARAPGSSEEERRTGRSQLWGRVADANGAAVEGTLVTPEGYRLTALAAVESARRVAAGEAPPGALTPSLAFGARYVASFEGCDLAVPAPVSGAA